MAQASIHDLRRAAPSDSAPAEALRRVELPLRDLEFAVECYLLDHGSHLDIATRRFLAQLRDALGQVSLTAHELADCAATRR